MDLHNSGILEDASNQIQTQKFEPLTPLFVYGVKPDVHGGIFFASDNANLIYPAGCGIAVYNTKDRRQTLIPLADRERHLTAICINKARNLVAFAERGDRPTVIVFDLETRKRQKTLRCAEFTSHEVISLAFSHDSKYLLAQGGSPDYSLVYFFWEKNKVITNLKTLASSKNPITEVSFHPKSHNVICIVGNGFFRMCRLTEGLLKPFGFQKGEHHMMNCHDWLSPRHVIIGTKTGKVLVLEEAELRTTLDIHSMMQEIITEASNQLQMSVPVRDERMSIISNVSVGGSSASGVQNEDKFVNAIFAFKGGFICSIGFGRVLVCELEKPLKSLSSDEEIKFRISSLIMLPKGTGSTCYKGNMKHFGSKVTALAMNNNETQLIGLTDTLQLVVHNFKEPVTTGAAKTTAANPPGVLSSGLRVKTHEFSFLCYPFHNGAITGMDVCYRKPIVVTCGTDKTVRVWNYQSLEMELSKEFEENVSSVALHPTGLYILAGFFDRLRLLNLLIDDIRVFREFSVKNATVCAFSRGGHLLAAVGNKNIEVYSTVNFKKTADLRGHNGTVASMSFSSDDSTLVSCGSDGAIYEWDIGNHGKRKHEIVMKGCTHNDICMSNDPEKEALIIYAVSSDKTIKQIQRSTLIREIDLHTLTLTAVALSIEGRFLFTGSTGGRIQSFQFPLTLPGEWIENKMHGGAVTQMRLSPDHKRLISAGNDGSLCIWHVKAADGIALEAEQKAGRFEFANEILITKTELEEKNKLVFELQQQVDETKTESEYQLRLKENQFFEENKVKQKQYTTQVSDLRHTIHKAQNTIENNKKNYENTLRKVKEENEKALINLADQYKRKLIIEYQRLEDLQAENEALRKNFEEKVQEMEAEKLKAIEESRMDFERKLKNKDEEVGNREHEAETRVKAIEEVLKQTEEDADKEILEIKTKYERALRIERENNVRLRGETGVMKKKYQGAMKETEETKTNIQKMSIENNKLQQTIKGLEKDIVDLKKEVKSRDEVIAERERKITEVKRSGIELEKNRYVLEHKIEDLRRQIQPKDENIVQLQSQIQEMEQELTTIGKNFSDQNVQLQDLRSKVTSSATELSSERKKSAKLTVMLNRMKKEWVDVGSVQDTKALKDSVGKLSKKYEQSSDIGDKFSDLFKSEEQENAAALKEILRQKAFLERTMESLRSQMKKQRVNHQQKHLKMMRDNGFLLKEVEELKKELKAARGYRVPNRLTVNQSTNTERDL